MTQRAVLVEALVAEILGPRGGPNETLSSDEDPLDEYLVGVLAPFSSPSVEADAEEELIGDDFPAGDDEDDPGAVTAGAHAERSAPVPSLVLDPRARPASMGVSFAVDAHPVVDIAATWARYTSDAHGDWTRQPHGEMWGDVDCALEPTLRPSSDPSVILRVRASRDPAGTWKVSIFLINMTQVGDGRATTPDHVFQPQLRVRCREPLHLVPLEREHPAQDEEDEGLALLYSDRPVLARGHLASALWRAVDPERAHPAGLSRGAPPFAWIDGPHLFGSAASDFTPADLRTEFVPVIAVNAPDKAWAGGASTPPQLDPAALAEITDPGELRAALTPLADAYEAWISRQRRAAGGPAPGTAAHRHLAACDRAATRLRDGIEVLATDAEALRAFCFANRAIALQSQWTKGRVNSWWPFQVAFQLINLRAIVEPDHNDRSVCDLLWFPTGGGKTEAYLGLAAFTMTYRRRRAANGGAPAAGAGVTVLSRYTLRLLTIQQFRRALALLAASEWLRVAPSSGQRGWRPSGWRNAGDLPWGTSRFSVGLWVGGNVTPNNLQDFEYMDANNRIIRVFGAISILEGANGDGDPAQVLSCPACHSVLAVPPDGVRQAETRTLHLVMADLDPSVTPSVAPTLSADPFEVTDVRLATHAAADYVTVSIDIRATADATSKALDDWFVQHVRARLGRGSRLVAARPSRPGYFITTTEWGRRRSEKPIDFEIFCANPDCDLNVDMAWSETTEVGSWPIHPAFDRGDGTSSHCPIPAWTVDEQVYARCPSMVVATVDKFARLAFEPRAGSLFGVVDRLNEHLGYYRSWSPPLGPASLPQRPREDPTSGRNVAVSGFPPPDLILQDELHLIEGPLGSMVGIYEAAIDLLASTALNGGVIRPKYIASTATVRQAGEQVQSLFARSLDVFPPSGITVEDNFFSAVGSSHPLDDADPGRLYVGVVAPGRGAQTPIIRLWSRLLQAPLDQRLAGVPDTELDAFWTLVGYFNAIRELAGAVALARQDILQRLSTIAATPRTLDEQEPMELSSRANSLDLPGMLDELTHRLGSAHDPVNAVVATSMFGTGVDVERLGLMVVHGQPKTTSAYIQATGRVGRSTGGLVVTFYRAARPRDLSYYEYFAGYHSTLYRHVEAITVNPFAPRARDRALGPVAVSVLRQAAELPLPGTPVPVHERWRVQQRLSGAAVWYCRAGEMNGARTDPDVNSLPAILEARAAQQPPQRRPQPTDTENHAHSELDRWQQLAATVLDRLVYSEPTVTRPASRPVVLGDLAHLVANTGLAFENAPNSLREVEATVTIRGRG